MELYSAVNQTIRLLRNARELAKKPEEIERINAAIGEIAEAWVASQREVNPEFRKGKFRRGVHNGRGYYAWNGIVGKFRHWDDDGPFMGPRQYEYVSG